MNALKTIVPENYGYVILTFVATQLLLVWMSMKVGKARKKYNVQYPTMYANENDKDGKIFNCHQRAHQNTLETIHGIIVALLLAGLKFPLTSAGLGAVYIVGRVLYAQGYYTGVPAKRMRGTFGMFAAIALLLLSGWVGVDMLL